MRQWRLLVVAIIWIESAQGFQFHPLPFSRIVSKRTQHETRRTPQKNRQTRTRLFDSEDARLAQNIAGTLSRNLKSAEKDRSTLARDIARYNDQLSRAKGELERLEDISVKNQLELNSYEEQIRAARSRFVEFQAKSNDARQQLVQMENEMKGPSTSLEQQQPWKTGSSIAPSQRSSNDSLFDESMVLPSIAGLTFLTALRSVMQNRPQVRKEAAESRFNPVCDICLD